MGLPRCLNTRAVLAPGHSFLHCRVRGVPGRREAGGGIVPGEDTGCVLLSGLQRRLKGGFAQ